MASAMRKGIEAGREAFLAGRMPRKRFASASSPINGLFLIIWTLLNKPSRKESVALFRRKPSYAGQQLALDIMDTYCLDLKRINCTSIGVTRRVC